MESQAKAFLVVLSLQKIEEGMASLSGRRSGTDEQRRVMLEMAELKVATAAMEARQASILVMEAPVAAVMLVLMILHWVVLVGVAQSSQDGLHLNFSLRTFTQLKSKQMAYLKL